MFFWDSTYIYLIIPALIITGIAQAKVSSTFAKYSKVSNSRGLTGAKVARRILDMNGLRDIPVEHIRGKLTDHYDPRTKVVRLSDAVYNSDSIAAVGVAAHEVGHAVQHAKGYVPLKLRNTIIPVTQIGSKMAIPLFFMGMIFAMEPLMRAGIVLFATVVAFQLVTLPVEFNASSRAMNTLVDTEMLAGEEVRGARKVLSAAAMTYVAALLMALAQLLRLIILTNRRSD